MRSKGPSIVRKPTNLSLDVRLVAEAKGLDINISRVAEESIARAVGDEKARLWKIENRENLEKWNDFLVRDGLPLTRHRTF